MTSNSSSAEHGAGLIAAGVGGDSPTESSNELGAQIRTRRKERRLTLDALANAAGVSRSLVSQVERGLASPSLLTLRRLAEALGVPMAALFERPDGEGHAPRKAEERYVVRADQRKRFVASRAQVAYELLTPDIDRRIEFLRGEFPPGATIPAEPGSWVAHSGEENVLVLDGMLDFYIGDELFRLGVGDSISFDCGVPHRIVIGNRPTTVIIAITPPGF